MVQSEQPTNPAKIQELVEKLKQKLNHFLVRTSQGEILGTVQDVRYSNSDGLQIALLPPQSKENSDVLFLNSKSISKVDSSQKTVFVNSNPDRLEARTTAEHSSQQSEVVEEEVIRLLQEELVIERNKQKVGEVVVRKEIETRMVEVPIRREKLVVEQVGSEGKPLAEIDLGRGQVTGIDEDIISFEPVEEGATVKGEFFSLKAARDILDAIALQPNPGCAKVRVELVLEDPENQTAYQAMFDRCRFKESK